MPRWQGVIATIPRTGAGNTGGITGNTTLTVDTRPFFNMSNTQLWDAAHFGISVTTIGSQAFNAYVQTSTAGGAIVFPIAGLSGIATTSGLVLPVVNERTVGVAAGATQSVFYGAVPTPFTVVFGNSATPGQSYSAVVYATLYKAD